MNKQFQHSIHACLATINNVDINEYITNKVEDTNKEIRRSIKRYHAWFNLINDGKNNMSLGNWKMNKQHIKFNIDDDQTIELTKQEYQNEYGLFINGRDFLDCWFEFMLNIKDYNIKDLFIKELRRLETDEVLKIKVLLNFRLIEDFDNYHKFNSILLTPLIWKNV